MTASLRPNFPQNLRWTLFQNQKENPVIKWDERSWIFLKVKVIGT